MKEEYVFNIDEIPDDDDSLLGVVVDIKRKWNKQRHCGIAFNLHGKPQVLHLATHKEVLCDKDLNGFLCWVRPSMHPAQQQVFCSYLELLGEAVEQGNKTERYF